MIKNNIYNITLTIIISLLLINCNDNKSETLPKNNLTPTVYSYEIINVYPHDINAYTQGLEFYNGVLYESVGRYGKSQLRRVDYKSGEVLSKKNINEKYFAEGITILDDLIYLLSWREKIGFIYYVNNFIKIHNLGCFFSFYPFSFSSVLVIPKSTNHPTNKKTHECGG
mgnify:CR=1 FL=1